MNVLILGSGYVGGALAHSGRLQGHNVWETHRDPQSPLCFVFERPETWDLLPEADWIFWTFEPSDPQRVREFVTHHRLSTKRVVVVGSLSSYAVTEADQEISEGSPLTESLPRVECEKIILDAGGVIVRAAGIYGPGRSPLSWIESGRVSRTQKLVNFIQRDDLVAILWAAAERASPGTSWIAADGRPYRWIDLIDRWATTYDLTVSKNIPPSTRSSKRANPTHTLKSLGVSLKFLDVFAGVRAIHGR